MAISRIDTIGQNGNDGEHYGCVISPVRPQRPPRRQCTGERTTPYFRGSSAFANSKKPYKNPYTCGRNHDDYVHGYLDAYETALAIKSHINAEEVTGGD